MSILAQRFLNPRQSATIAVSALAQQMTREGKPVISLAAGEPDFPTPPNVVESAVRAMAAGKFGYAPAAGIVELREAICAKLARDNGLHYRVDEISVGCGAKQSIFNAMMATLEPGDEVIVPSPSWVSFIDIVNMLGGVPVAVPSRAEDDFKLTPERLAAAITPRSKWLVLCSPSNPTGAVYGDDELAALAEVLAAHPHVHVMSDHIYEHLVFGDAPARTIGEVVPAFRERSVIINGVSKANCMTGWRVGYIAGPGDLIRAVNSIQSQATTSTSTISQWAALEAITGDQSYIARNNEEYRRRRDMVVERLNAIDGITCATPAGAFYVFPSCEGLMCRRDPGGAVIGSDVDLATYLLRSAHVAVVPGTAFNQSPFLRLAFSSSHAELDEALSRIAQACGSLR